MPCSGFVNATVRFGAVFRCRELYGAVRLHFMSYGAVRCGFPISYSKTYGAVRCGFQEGKNPTVCFGAVNRAEPHRTDRKNRTLKNPGKKRGTQTRGCGTGYGKPHQLWLVVQKNGIYGEDVSQHNISPPILRPVVSLLV